MVDFIIPLLFGAILVGIVSFFLTKEAYYRETAEGCGREEQKEHDYGMSSENKEEGKS